MLIKICVGLLLANIVAVAQTIQPSERQVEHFEVKGASRLAALAKLGLLSNTSLLVEVDSIPELQAPVAFSIDHTTVSAVARRLLPKEYGFRDVGSLLIVSPRAGARNRILTLPLGSFTLHPTGISGLEPFLGFTIERVTGCNPQSLWWSGPPMDLAMPNISLVHATFEKIVSRVADAPEPSMWTVTRESKLTGCISDPASKWQVGLYGFGRASSNCQTPFRASVGPSFIAPSFTKMVFADDCQIQTLGSMTPQQLDETLLPTKK